MERLSDKCPCNMLGCPKGGQCDFGCEKYAQWVADMRKALTAYEDAEEQGLLVRLPCKVEDTVYTIEKQRNEKGTHDTFIESYKVIAFQFEGAPHPFTQITGKTRGRFIRIDAIGKLVFLTRESAEAALAEMTDIAEKGN